MQVFSKANTDSKFSRLPAEELYVRMLSVLLIALISFPLACSAELWRCADGSYTNKSKPNCALLERRLSMCVKDGYRLIGVGKQASDLAPSDCPRATQASNKKRELWDQIAARRIMIPRHNEAKTAAGPPRLRARGGAQVSEETYRKVSGVNPFAGPAGMEHAMSIAKGETIINEIPN